MCHHQSFLFQLMTAPLNSLKLIKRVFSIFFESLILKWPWCDLDMTLVLCTSKAQLLLKLLFAHKLRSCWCLHTNLTLQNILNFFQPPSPGGLNYPVGDPVGGGDNIAPIFARIYTHHSWHLYALEGSVGMIPRKILKSKASNAAFPYSGRNMFFFFCFWNPELGGTRRLRPPLDPPLLSVSLYCYNISKYIHS